MHPPAKCHSLLSVPALSLGLTSDFEAQIAFMWNACARDTDTALSANIVKPALFVAGIATVIATLPPMKNTSAK